MICKKCGTEFEEGVFCPECGEKVPEMLDKSVDVEKSLEINENPGEIEVIKQQDRLKSKEDVVLFNKKRNIECITQEKIALEKEEHNKIDILKKKLMQTKSQEKRQEILKGFNYQFKTVDARNRMNFIEEKVNRKVPNIVKLSRIMGILSLISFLLMIVMSFLMSFINGNQKTISTMEIVLSFVFWICIIIWIIQKIIIFIKKLSKDYYLNLKDI